MHISEIARKIHATAKAKGWWEKLREAGTIHMLIVSEIAEATECARNGEPAAHFGEINPPLGRNLAEDYGVVTTVAENGKQYIIEPNKVMGREKPEGELVELADAVIRILDYCEFNEWDIEAAIKAKIDYNETRSHRHGGKAF